MSSKLYDIFYLLIIYNNELEEKKDKGFNFLLFFSLVSSIARNKIYSFPTFRVIVYREIVIVDRSTKYFIT